MTEPASPRTPKINQQEVIASDSPGGQKAAPGKDTVRAARPPRMAVTTSDVTTTNGGSEESYRVLLIDLNNFTSFPTLAIGILVSALRNAGHVVSVLSPLAHGIASVQRERRENRWHDLRRRVHLSTIPVVEFARNVTRDLREMLSNRADKRVVALVSQALGERPDIVLLSSYLHQYATVRQIGRLAKREGIPVLLGGPMFNVHETAKKWLEIPGIDAVYGGEADRVAPELVSAIVRRGDLGHVQGLMTKGVLAGPAASLRPLAGLPTPDFSDFPWHMYPVRIIPLMASRGCQWANCTFCSDIASASGRVFRSRPLEAVLSEMQEQSRRHQTRNFLFLDLKLNSDPSLFRGICESVQRIVPGAEWIGTVHVDTRRDNGLSKQDLRAAVSAGMRRVSFGLETGSQRLLDSMCKGSTVGGNSEFIRNASEAGLSIRCTMFQGYPGETVEDVLQTARFLEDHEKWIDRVRFNRLAIYPDTPVFESLVQPGLTDNGIHVSRLDWKNARAVYSNGVRPTLAYLKAQSRVLSAVYRINSKPLLGAARQFDGLM